VAGNNPRELQSPCDGDHLQCVPPWLLNAYPPTMATKNMRELLQERDGAHRFLDTRDHLSPDGDASAKEISHWMIDWLADHPYETEYFDTHRYEDPDLFMAFFDLMDAGSGFLSRRLATEHQRHVDFPFLLGGALACFGMASYR
jgi:hypothetical protein